VESPTPPENLSPLAMGALAAELLERTCRSAPVAQDPLRLEIVRYLALDLKRQLSALARVAGEDAPVDYLVEAALRCADLATLTACNLSELQARSVPTAATAACLATEAVRALRTPIEAASRGLDGDRAEYVARDVLSAAWRAGLAERQVDEQLEGGVPG
jgi:hypothetical protein